MEIDIVLNKRMNGYWVYCMTSPYQFQYCIKI